MTCHAVMPAENPLCRQLFVVAVDRSDRIAPIRICSFGGGCGDLILAVVGALLFVDQGPLDVDELDLLLEAIGIGTDLTQLLALEVAHETGGRQRCSRCCRCFPSSARSAPGCHRWHAAGRQRLCSETL